MDHASTHARSGLVVLGSGPEAGRTLPLTDGRHLIGRDPQNDLRLADRSVSRRHAAITLTDQGAWIEDLGSTGGTRVNQDEVTNPRPLHPGDHIQLGSLTLRLADTSAGATATFPATVDSSSSRQDIGSQHEGVFYNAARDQHISYVQQIKREREPFLREIAATRTKARSLIWLGLLVSVIGYGWALVTIGGSFSILTDAMSSGGSVDEPIFRNYFGPPILGVPSVVWAAGLSVAGTVLLIVGVILHITATARRRRVDRELPLTGG